jgi:general secretion pathway protein A
MLFPAKCAEIRTHSADGVRKELPIAMYLDHYQLKKEPFGAVPDPDFVWLGNRHADAIETLQKGLLDHERCLILTGDIGTGKTALVKRMARRQDLVVIFLTASGLELQEQDFHRLLAAELRMDFDFARPEEFAGELSRVLMQASSAGKQAVLVVDEAHRLTREALKDLAGLAALTTNGKCLLKLLLVGALDLDSTANSAAAEGVLPKIAVRCSLEPLTEADTHAYIAHRLKAAGREQPLFDPAALQAIYALSKGLPRLINIICDHALLYGYGANQQMIDGGVIRECSRDLSVALDLEEPPQDRPLESTLPAAPAETLHAAASRLLSGAGRSWLYVAAALAAAGVLYVIWR